MDRQQFATLAIGIKAAYPASGILEDNASMDFWYMMLRDLPYEAAENAVMEHVCTSVYPPNIAEIRKLCAERTRPRVPSFDEAWGAVQKAVSRYGWNNAQKAFETMDELTLSVVRNLGWSRLCSGENPAADRANFREAYEARAALRRNADRLPGFVAERKARLQEKYVPVAEAGETPRTEAPAWEEMAEPTDEQLERRSRMVEEAKRRLLGG